MLSKTVASRQVLGTPLSTAIAAQLKKAERGKLAFAKRKGQRDVLPT
jgi:hypothetical protein